MRRDYLVNETSSTKIFFAKDRYVFAIQEAIDVDPERWGFWYPIESIALDFCGNGNSGVKVHPGEFIMFLAPKYEGEEKNAMRIRLQIGESLYISRSYEGTYSTKQFNLSKEAWYYKYLKGSKDCSTFDNFYGAVPKEFDHH